MLSSDFLSVGGGMHIIFIGFGAVSYVMMHALAELCKKSGKNTSFTIIARSDRFKQELHDSPLKYTSLIVPDVKGFLHVAGSNDHIEGLKTTGEQIFVVNAATPELNIPIISRALTHGIHYMDMASVYDEVIATKKTLPQFAYEKQFTERGSIALLNTGISPGVTELCIAYMVKKYAISPRSIQLYLTERLSADVPLFSWSPATAIDEMMTPAVAIQDKKNVIQPPFTGVSRGEEATYYGITQEELTSISRAFPEIANVAVKVTGAEILPIKFLYDMKLLSHEIIGDIALIDLIKSKAPRASSREEVKDAIAKKAIHHAGFGFQIDILDEGGKLYHIHGDFGKKEFFALIGTVYEGATNVSYPTGVGAAVLLLLGREVCDTPGMYTALEMCLRCSIDQLEKNIETLRLLRIRIWEGE